MPFSERALLQNDLTQINLSIQKARKKEKNTVPYKDYHSITSELELKALFDEEKALSDEFYRRLRVLTYRTRNQGSQTSEVDFISLKKANDSEK
jgi:hypothetical protein